MTKQDEQNTRTTNSKLFNANIQNETKKNKVYQL